MVGIVIVSHSQKLAESVVELTTMMAAEAKIEPAGGLDDGTFGTSFEKIQHAIETVYSEDGVIILMDMGSAVMTTEMVIEMMPDKKIKMIDCPLVEGAVSASISAMCGASVEQLEEELAKVALTKKF